MEEWVYRIVGLDDWREALGAGRVPRCGSDERDGFVHLSTAGTCLETANLYFDVSEQPVVLEIEAAALGEALRWEAVESRGGQRFPHLYAAGIPVDSVRSVTALEHTPAGFVYGERTPRP